MNIFIRQSAVYIFVAILMIYAWKDWFKSLCGLILLTALMNRPDFPRSLGGIQGLNTWNILLAVIFLAWLVNRRRERLLWDMPALINVFLVLWLSVILVGWVRMIVDRSQLTDTLIDLISEQLINTIKWPITGLLLFDCCRTRHRIKLALACIILFFGLLAVQISRNLPSIAVLESEGMVYRTFLMGELGIDISGAGKMMSGVPWAVLAIMPLLKKQTYRFFILGECLICIYAVALIGLRSAYVACFATLLLLCLLRWRRYLLLLPFLVLILSALFPGARDRMLLGFNEINFAGEETVDTYDVTSGRNIVWPYVISKICESPVFGFGREAMIRTGLTKILKAKFGEGDAFEHPHQAYLEVLLDNGLIGFVIIVSMYMFIMVYSARLFVDRGDSLYNSVGGFTLALLTSHLVISMGGQSFYFRQVDFGLWCAIGVMLRLYVTRDSLVPKVNGASVANTYITELPRTL